MKENKGKKRYNLYLTSDEFDLIGLAATRTGKTFTQYSHDALISRAASDNHKYTESMKVVMGQIFKRQEVTETH